MAASHYAYNTLKMPGPVGVISILPESSTGGNKKPRAIPPGTRKVSVNEDGTGGAFTISSTLDDK